MFRCNARHTGVCTSTGLPAPLMNAKLPVRAHVAWKFRTDQLNRSNPIGVKGVVYVGSNNGHLYALRAKSGALIRTFHPSGALTSSTAFDDGLVYFTGRNDQVYALDVRNGHLRWVFQTGKPLPPSSYGWDFYQSSPLIARDAVYFGSGDGFFYAVDAKAGVERWAYNNPVASIVSGTGGRGWNRLFRYFRFRHGARSQYRHGQVEVVVSRQRPCLFLAGTGGQCVPHRALRFRTRLA